MRPLWTEIKHNYILHTFPKKNSCTYILTINFITSSCYDRDYQDKQNVSQRPKKLIFQRQETHSPTAPRKSEMQTKQLHTLFDYEGGSLNPRIQGFLILSFQADLCSAKSTSEVEAEFRFNLFLTIKARLLRRVVELVKQALVSCGMDYKGWALS